MACHGCVPPRVPCSAQRGTGSGWGPQFCAWSTNRVRVPCTPCHLHTPGGQWPRRQPESAHHLPLQALPTEPSCQSRATAPAVPGVQLAGQEQRGWQLAKTHRAGSSHPGPTLPAEQSPLRKGPSSHRRATQPERAEPWLPLEPDGLGNVASGGARPKAVCCVVLSACHAHTTQIRGGSRRLVGAGVGGEGVPAKGDGAPVVEVRMPGTRAMVAELCRRAETH